MLHRILGLLACDMAIDLGTANTQICVAGEGLVLNEPSVVAVEAGANRVVAGGRAVGHLARQMLGRAPASISVVRPLAAGVVTDFELCETMHELAKDKIVRLDELYDWSSAWIGGANAFPRDILAAVRAAGLKISARQFKSKTQRFRVAGPVSIEDTARWDDIKDRCISPKQLAELE